MKGRGHGNRKMCFTRSNPIAQLSVLPLSGYIQKSSDFGYRYIQVFSKVVYCYGLLLP